MTSSRPFVISFLSRRVILENEISLSQSVCSCKGFNDSCHTQLRWKTIGPAKQVFNMNSLLNLLSYLNFLSLNLRKKIVSQNIFCNRIFIYETKIVLNNFCAGKIGEIVLHLWRFISEQKQKTRIRVVFASRMITVNISLIALRNRDCYWLYYYCIHNFPTTLQTLSLNIRRSIVMSIELLTYVIILYNLSKNISFTSNLQNCTNHLQELQIESWSKSDRFRIPHCRKTVNDIYHHYK